MKSLTCMTIYISDDIISLILLGNVATKNTIQCNPIIKVEPLYAPMTICYHPPPHPHPPKKRKKKKDFDCEEFSNFYFLGTYYEHIHLTSD